MPSKPPAPADPNGAWLDRLENRDRTHAGRHASLRERRRESLLCDWYGPDAARAEILAHQTAAKPVGDVVARVLQGFGMEGAGILGDLQEGWGKLVGADMARHTEPAAVQGTRLIIEVSDSTWLYVLERQHRKVIESKVREFTGGKIAEIRFLTAGRRPLPSRFQRGADNAGAGKPGPGRPGA